MSNFTIISGTVSAGRRLGRELGFPTANLSLDADGFTPRPAGVWFAKAEVEGSKYWALVNVGTRPTVDGKTTPKAEAWLIGFEGDLYGEELRIELLKYLRAEERFPTVEELKAAIEKDREQAFKIIENHEFTL